MTAPWAADLPTVRERPAGTVTLAEMADRFNVGATTPARWRERRDRNGFPEPVAVLGGDWAAGNLRPVGRLLYDAADVDRWRATYTPTVGAAAHRGGPRGGFRPGNYMGGERTA